MKIKVVPERSSENINLVRFVLCFLIVFLHSGTIMMDGKADLANIPHSMIVDFIIHVVSGFICQAAVPLFMFISAYLLFCKYAVADNKFLEYKNQLKKRSKTLLVPYIAWNIVGTMFIVVKYLTEGKPFDDFPKLYELFTAIPKHGIQQFPANRVMWFIRELILLVLLSPVCILLFKRWKLASFIILSGVYIAGVLPNIPYIASPLTYVFFCLGAIAGLARCDISLQIGRYKTAVNLFLGGVILIDAVLFLHNIQISHILSVYRVVALFSCMTFVYYVDNMPRLKQWLTDSARYTFFIYALHGFLMKLIIPVLFKLVFDFSTMGILSCYVIASILDIVICIMTYRFIEKYIPILKSVLSGNR